MPTNEMSAAPTALDSEQELLHLRARAEAVLAEAARLGASAAEVSLSLGQGLSVTVRLGEVETLEFHRDQGLSVSVYNGHRRGSASSSDLSDDSLRETVAAAWAIAQYTGEDACNGPAEAALLVTEVPDLDLYHPWSLTAEDAIALARECEQAGRDDARIINSEGATVSSGSHVRVFGTSQGFVEGYASSHHSLSCVLVAEQEDGMQRDYWYDSQSCPQRLAPAAQIGAKAAARTLARLGAGRPATGEYGILLAPDVARGFIGHFVAAISGGALYRKSSFLLDRLNTQVFPEWLSLREYPHLAGGLASAPFDSDGLPTHEQDFVRDGVLVSYALGLYAARRLGAMPTGNGGGVRNLRITHGDADGAALARELGDGILVTEVMGQGVNLVTGDYSRGAAGFRIEGGEIAGPLEEFTIAGNLNQLFAGLVAAGSDVDARGAIHCGTLWLDRVKVAGA